MVKFRVKISIMRDFDNIANARSAQDAMVSRIPGDWDLIGSSNEEVF